MALHPTQYRLHYASFCHEVTASSPLDAFRQLKPIACPLQIRYFDSGWHTCNVAGIKAAWLDYLKIEPAHK